MKRLIFFLLLLITTVAGKAQGLCQAVINIAGSTYTASNITFEWNVGESGLDETMAGGIWVVTNGLLQPMVLAATSASASVMLQATNILTPNGDGKNDYWVIKDILSYPNNTVTIYDRAGRVVYTKHGYANDWGGTLGNSPLSQDTYYYLIDLGIGQPKMKGFITIVRDK